MKPTFLCLGIALTLIGANGFAETADCEGHAVQISDSTSTVDGKELHPTGTDSEGNLYEINTRFDSDGEPSTWLQKYSTTGLRSQWNCDNGFTSIAFKHKVALKHHSTHRRHEGYCTDQDYRIARLHGDSCETNDSLGTGGAVPIGIYCYCD